MKKFIKRSVSAILSSSFIMSCISVFPYKEVFSEQDRKTSEKLYASVLDDYANYIIPKCAENFAEVANNPEYQLSDTWMYSTGKLSDYGYQFYDLDGNGIDELFVLDLTNSYEAHVAAIYTIYNNTPKQIATGGARWNYYVLCGDNILGESGSGGASIQAYTFYHLIDGELVVFEEYICDTGVWYFADSDEDGRAYSEDSMTIISESEAYSNPNTMGGSKMALFDECYRFSEYSGKSDSSELKNKCGDDAYWDFDEKTGNLTISGSGAMYDYDKACPIFSYSPQIDPSYCENQGDISHIKIQEGITAIGNRAFYGSYIAVENYLLPESLKEIGDYAFFTVGSEEVPKSITIPKNVVHIGTEAIGYYEYDSFDSNNELISIKGKIPNFTIYGYSGTEADRYAGENDFNFIALDDFEEIPDVKKNTTDASNKKIETTTTTPKNDEPKKFGDYTYYINSSHEAVIIKYNGNDESVSIPSEIEDCPVTIISGIEGPAELEYQRIGAFEDNTKIKSVIIPDTVKTIELYSFKGCCNLGNVEMSQNIETIEGQAFSECDISYVFLPKSITNLENESLGFSDGTVLDNFIIYGFKGTAAEKYANNNDIQFIARNSDKEIIQPLRIDLEFEKIADYSTPPTDDTLHFNNLPVYKVIADIKNIDSKEAKNIVVKLNTSEIMTLIDCENEQQINSIKGIDHVTIEWKTTINISNSNSTICYVDAKADNSVVSSSQLTIQYEGGNIGKDNRLDLKKDIWKFTNTSKYFNKGHYIKDSYLKIMKSSNFSNVTSQKITDFINQGWHGSCYGMSVTAILNKIGIINIADYDSDANCLYDADTPKDNDDVYSLIEAYHYSKYFSCISAEVIKQSSLETKDILSDFINEVENVKYGGVPIVILTHYYEEDVFKSDTDFKSKGHAIVAYDIERSSTPYKIKNLVSGEKEDYTIRISIYDCALKVGEPIYMYISDDLEHWIIPEYCQDIREDVKRSSDYRNILNIEYFKNEGDFYFINDPALLDCLSLNDSKYNNFVTLCANNKTDLLIKWNNSTYKFKLDKLLNESEFPTKEITTYWQNEGAENENGISEAYLNYVLPSIDGEYTISSSNDECEDVNYILTYDNSMICAEASNVKDVTFTPNSVNINANGGSYSVSLTFNEGYYTMPWYTISATGSHTDDITIKQTDDGILLNGDNLKNVKISANNLQEDVELEFTSDSDTVLLSNKDNVLQVYEDNDSDGEFESLIKESSETEYKRNFSPIILIIFISVIIVIIVIALLIKRHNRSKMQ